LSRVLDDGHLVMKDDAQGKSLRSGCRGSRQDEMNSTAICTGSIGSTFSGYTVLSR
jgi:hypothetical protein